MISFGEAVILLAIFGASAEGLKLNRADGDQDWGYVDVRTGAHMFYWLYHTTASADYTSRPLVMWLQGGPGASSTGYGNFEELGPLDTNLNPRDTTWVNHVNVLFVDNPVGTGYSYVDSSAYLTTNNAEIATDLVTFTAQFMDSHPEFQTVPFYVYCESYGGKMTAEYALNLYQAIQGGEISMDFRGVGLGDSWISPIDSVMTWAPFLHYSGIVDTNGYNSINEYAESTKSAVDSGSWSQATNLWSYTEGIVEDVTHGVDFYNILYKTQYYGLKNFTDPIERLYHRHVQQRMGDALDDIMNGQIKQQLGIPAGVTWGGQSNAVFSALSADFMKPVTSVVEQLLEETDINVVVFTGNLDLIVDTYGTLQWIENLQWSGASAWKSADRDGINVDGYLEGYVKSSGRFRVYWVDRSGHMVPTDNPQLAIEMLKRETGLA